MLEQMEVVEKDEDELLFWQGLGLDGQSLQTGGVELPVRRFREKA